MRVNNALLWGLILLLGTLTITLYPDSVARKEVKVFGTFEDYVKNKPLKVYQTESEYDSDKKIKNNHGLIKVIAEKTADGRTIGTGFLIPADHNDKYLKLNEYGFKTDSTTKKLVATFDGLENLSRKRALKIYKSEHCEADAYNDTILIYKDKPLLIRITYYYNRHSGHIYQKVYRIPKSLLSPYLQKMIAVGAITPVQAGKLRQQEDKHIILKYDYLNKYLDQAREQALKAKYNRGPVARTTSSAAAEPVQATAYYLHRDAQGSTTAVTDRDGKLIERVTYGIYGAPTFWDYTQDPSNPVKRSRSVVGNDILFQGRRYDQETGLYYFRNRYYDPIMGRFLQTDPMGYADSMNPYQAFNQNPVNFVDPFGLNKGITDDVRWVLSQPGIVTTGGFMKQDWNNFSSNFRSREGILEYSAKWLDNFGRYTPGLSLGINAGEALSGKTVTGDKLGGHERVQRGLLAELEALTLFSTLWKPKPQTSTRTNQPQKSGTRTGGELEPSTHNPIKNQSGNLDNASQAARTQPHSGRGVVIRNELSTEEFAWAKQYADHRGGVFRGQTLKNQPGIDGYIGDIPVQLKELSSKSPTAVTKAIKLAGQNATNAGYTNVEVAVKAINITKEAILSGPIRNILKQQTSLSSIRILTKDGWVLFFR